MNRVQRITYGPDFRGHKPIQVCIVHYRDKEEILRKARLLKGSNIYISEDFSRKGIYYLFVQKGKNIAIINQNILVQISKYQRQSTCINL